MAKQQKKPNPRIALALAALRRIKGRGRVRGVPLDDLDEAIGALEAECPTCPPPGNTPPPDGDD